MENSGNNEPKHDIFTKLTLISGVALLSLITIASLVSAPFINRGIKDSVNDKKMERLGTKQTEIYRQTTRLFFSAKLDYGTMDSIDNMYGRALSIKCKYSQGKSDSLLRQEKSNADSMQRILFLGYMRHLPGQQLPQKQINLPINRCRQQMLPPR